MCGNYDEALARLMKEERVSKFLRMLRNDPSFDMLSAAIEKGDWSEAFRGAHTLKGVALNLSATKLATSSSELCEDLRPQKKTDKTMALFEVVKKDHEMTNKAIDDYFASL